MKYPKMLGLAALAALALMAMVGAGTASAKVCSKDGKDNTHTPLTACAAGHGNVYSGPFTATTHVETPAVLVSGFITVTCHSHIEGTINGTTTTGTITSLTFSGCKDGSGNACTAKTTATAAAPWSASLTRTGAGPNGTMQTGTVTGEFTCFGVTCKYHATTTGSKGEIVVTAGETATVKATNVPLTRETGSSFLCSSTATWSGGYTVTTPDSLYIT